MTPPPTTDATVPPDAGARHNRRRAGAIIGGCAALAIVIAVTTVVLVSRHDTGTDHRYVIPAGTAARIDAGDEVNILPAELHVAPGDTLTVVNEDSAPQFVGVATVDPGETMSYEFPRRGEFVSVCTIHTSGAISIYVDG